jgi:hypothetical protein
MRYNKLVNALYSQYKAEDRVNRMVYSKTIDLMRQGFDTIRVDGSFDILTSESEGWTQLYHTINESVPCYVQLIVFSGASSYKGRQIKIEHKMDYKDLFKKAVDHLFQLYNGLSNDGSPIQSMVCTITPFGDNQGSTISYLANLIDSNKQYNCLLSLIASSGIDINPFLDAYKIFDPDSEQYRSMLDCGLEKIYKDNHREFTVDDIIPYVNIPISCRSISILCKILDIKLEVFTGLKKYIKGLKPISSYNTHGYHNLNVVVENGHCNKVITSKKITSSCIVDSFKEIPSNCCYIEYSDKGFINYYLTPIDDTYCIHKTYDETIYGVDDLLCIDDSRCLYRMICKEYKLVKPHPIINKVLKSSDVFIGMNVIEQLDSLKQYYRYDINSCYSSYSTSLYYKGFPNGLLYTNDCITDYTCFIVCSKVVFLDSIREKLEWLGIMLSTGSCITLLDYYKYRDLGITIEIDYVIDTDRWVDINMQEIMLEYGMKDCKSTRNSCIGWFLCGGISESLHRNIKIKNEAEYKMLIEDCTRNGLLFSRRDDILSVDIPKSEDHTEAMLNIHSYFMSYARWKLIDGLMLEESLGNRCVGYKTDMLIFCKESTLLKVDNKMGNWKLEHGDLNIQWYAKTRTVYSIKDNTSNLISNNKLPMIRYKSRCIEGPAGVGKSYEARTSTSISTVLCCPTWQLVNDSNCKIARTTESLFHLSKSYEDFLKLGIKMPLLIYVDECPLLSSSELEEMKKRAKNSIFCYIFDWCQKLGIKECVDYKWFIDQGCKIETIIRHDKCRVNREDGEWLDSLRGLPYKEIVERSLTKLTVIDSIDSIDYNCCSLDKFPHYISGSWKKIKRFNKQFESKMIPCVDLKVSCRGGKKERKKSMKSIDCESIWWNKSSMNDKCCLEDVVCKHTCIPDIGMTVDSCLGSTLMRPVLIDYKTLIRGDSLYIALTRTNLKNIYLIDL